jgi:hypothetical protein
MRPSLLVNSLTRYPVKKTSEVITLRGLFLFLDKAKASLYNFVSANVSVNGQRR